MISTSIGIADWIKERKLASGLSIEQTSLSAISTWFLSDGALRHESGRFFSIIGIESIGVLGHKPISQPIISQPEVGILGFIFHVSDTGLEVLIQAKTEPGNTGGTQIAPTVQATQSNYSRVHRGSPTRFLAHFIQDGSVLVHGSRQSEQGTRFLGKYNRNASVFLTKKDELLGSLAASWSWFPVADLFQLLDHDFMINTDARSVLVCSDWNQLAMGRPFDSGNAFGSKLRASFRYGSNEQQWLGKLGELRKQYITHYKTQNISKLNEFNLSDEGIVGQDFSVNLYRISANDREVSEWSQPLISSHTKGQVVLYCQMREGILYFLVAPSVEIGLLEYVQFGPSINRVDNKQTTTSTIEVDDRFTTTIAEYTQSDEGGRFYQSLVHYAIKEIDSAIEVDAPGMYWMTLKEIYALLQREGVFTNEFRSVLSLLLKFL